MEKSSLEIKVKRIDRVYRPKEIVDGVIVVNAYKGWTHNGVNMSVSGVIHTSHAGRNLATQLKDGKPIQLMKYEQVISPQGKFPDGSTEIPFSFEVKPVPGQILLESYHGVYVSVIYSLQVHCDRGVMKKDLGRSIEFIIEIPNATLSMDPLPVPFSITPQSLENVSKDLLSTLPNFKIVGKLHRSKCPINQPLTGEIIIESSVAPIRSIELQLVRVESVDREGLSTKEATEIQNIQIGDGNICKNFTVPMYMVFPRLFSCPTVVSEMFKIEFEVNLIVVMGDGYMITENFPLVLFRDQ